MEKEHQPDSMATITMKPEYPPSEYSGSEPPPAYRQGPSSSVQIARIAALTVVAASFILGSFILASSWVAARASCHQLEQLDAMLDKELALESRAYGNDGLMSDEPLPIANAHALHGVPPQVASEPEKHSSAPAPAPASQTKEDTLNQAESKIDEDKLQKIDENESAKRDQSNASSDESSESENSAEEGEDELDAIRPSFKLPIQFDLDELAGAFLANNQQKGRMNCVVERRRDEPERRFPFNILSAFAPRNAHAERIAIICHGGDEPRSMSFPEPQSQVFAFPMAGPVRLPLRPQPERAPAQDRMPQFMPLSRPSGFPIPMPWDSSEEQSGGPREMRIHVQRVIAIPAPHNLPPPENMPMGNMAAFAPPPLPQRDQNEQPTILHQFVPQNAPTQELEQPEPQIQKMQIDSAPLPMNLPWGLTTEDLQAIHRTAEDAAASEQQQRRDQQMDNDMQEVKTIVNTLAAAAAEAEAEAQAQAQAEEQQRQDARLPQEPQMMQEPPMMQAARVPLDAPAQAPRAPRTLLLPQEMPMEERPHYMQPRSVRSVDAVLKNEKRVKRCSCNCGE